MTKRKLEKIRKQYEELSARKNSELNSPRKEDKVDLVKEFFDIISEIKIGLSGKISASVENYFSACIELDVFSKCYRKDEDTFTSGVKAYIQVGPDASPLLQCGFERSKNVSAPAPFDLFEYEYESKSFADFNIDREIGLPLGGCGSITVNTAEAIDFCSKLFNP